MNIEKIAIPVYNNRISPLFDVAGKIILVEIVDKKIIGMLHLDINENPEVSRFNQLFELGIKTIICSSISRKFANYITSKDIILIPGVYGDIEEVIEAYRKNHLIEDSFAMPGCKWRGRGHKEQKGRCLRYKEIINLKNIN
jgi:predicted Fe-Mo cluster-binding NifX family protein